MDTSWTHFTVAQWEHPRNVFPSFCSFKGIWNFNTNNKFMYTYIRISSQLPSKTMYQETLYYFFFFRKMHLQITYLANAKYQVSKEYVSYIYLLFLMAILAIWEKSIFFLFYSYNTDAVLWQIINLYLRKIELYFFFSFVMVKYVRQGKLI